MFPRQTDSDRYCLHLSDWALMKSDLSNPPAKRTVSFEVSVWLQGRGGDLMLDSGVQVLEVEEERAVTNWVQNGQNRRCFSHVFLTVSSFCRLTDRTIGACRPQQSCSRAWGNTALQTCNHKTVKINFSSSIFIQHCVHFSVTLSLSTIMQSCSSNLFTLNCKIVCCSNCLPKQLCELLYCMQMQSLIYCSNRP